VLRSCSAHAHVVPVTLCGQVCDEIGSREEPAQEVHSPTLYEHTLP